MRQDHLTTEHLSSLSDFVLWMRQDHLTTWPPSIFQLFLSLSSELGMTTAPLERWALINYFCLCLMNASRPPDHPVKGHLHVRFHIQFSVRFACKLDAYPIYRPATIAAHLSSVRKSDEHENRIGIWFSVRFSIVRPPTTQDLTWMTWFDINDLIWHEWHDLTWMTCFDMNYMIWDEWHDLRWMTWFDMNDMIWHEWHDFTWMTWFDMNDMIWHDRQDLTWMTIFDIIDKIWHEWHDLT
jgi:hypothetical protein